MSQISEQTCEEKAADQIHENCTVYNCTVAQDGSVESGMDVKRLMQQFFGAGSQDPARMKQVADILLKCYVPPSNGKATKKLWYDADNNITEDPDLVCRVVEIGAKGDDPDECPTSSIGMDLVGIVQMLQSMAARNLLNPVDPPAPPEALAEPECWRLLVTGTVDIPWVGEPHLHPDWDSLTTLEQCRTDPCWCDETGAEPFVLPPVTIEVKEWAEMATDQVSVSTTTIYGPPGENGECPTGREISCVTVTKEGDKTYEYSYFDADGNESETLPAGYTYQIGDQVSTDTNIIYGPPDADGNCPVGREITTVTVAKNGDQTYAYTYFDADGNQTPTIPAGYGYRVADQVSVSSNIIFGPPDDEGVCPIGREILCVTVAKNGAKSYEYIYVDADGNETPTIPDGYTFKQPIPVLDGATYVDIICDDGDPYSVADSYPLTDRGSTYADEAAWLAALTAEFACEITIVNGQVCFPADCENPATDPFNVICNPPAVDCTIVSRDQLQELSQSIFGSCVAISRPGQPDPMCSGGTNPQQNYFDWRARHYYAIEIGPAGCTGPFDVDFSLLIEDQQDHPMGDFSDTWVNPADVRIRVRQTPVIPLPTDPAQGASMVMSNLTGVTTTGPVTETFATAGTVTGTFTVPGSGVYMIEVFGYVHDIDQNDGPFCSTLNFMNLV